MVTGAEVTTPSIEVTYGRLRCQMSDTCPDPVIAMIDDKGFVYCAHHGQQRRAWRPCRMLRAWEYLRLEAGKVIDYKRRSRAETEARYDREQTTPAPVASEPAEFSERQKERARVKSAYAAAAPGGAVIEYHYSDGDVGAYGVGEGSDSAESEAVCALWLGFAAGREGHMPTKIVIRLYDPETDE